MPHFWKLALLVLHRTSLSLPDRKVPHVQLGRLETSEQLRPRCQDCDQDDTALLRLVSEAQRNMMFIALPRSLNCLFISSGSAVDDNSRSA